MKIFTLILSLMVFSVSAESNYPREKVTIDFERVVNTNKPITIKYLEDHLNKFPYQDWHSESKFQSFIAFSEDEFLPEMEIIIIISNNKLFAAIVSGKVTSNNIKHKEKTSGYNIYYFNENTERQNKFKKIYYKIISVAS